MERIAKLRQIVKTKTAACIDDAVVDTFTANRVLATFKGLNKQEQIKFAGLTIDKMANYSQKKTAVSDIADHFNVLQSAIKALSDAAQTASSKHETSPEVALDLLEDAEDYVNAINTKMEFLERKLRAKLTVQGMTQQKTAEMTSKQVSALGRAVSAIANARDSINTARRELRAAGIHYNEIGKLQNTIEDLLVRMAEEYEASLSSTRSSTKS